MKHNENKVELCLYNTEFDHSGVFALPASGVHLSILNLIFVLPDLKGAPLWSSW